MTEISITRTIYEYFDDIEETEIRQNIIMYMEKYNIGNKGISTKTKHKLKFKNQIGGVKHNINLKDGKTYYYNINDIQPIGKSKYKMLFMTFDDINECACLTYGKKESNNTVLRIDGIKSFDECIFCKDKKHKFKSGDILMQIILELVKNNPQFSHIDKIELADSSQKQCYDIGLKLIYLRTITHGIPYYAKFGFRPVLKTDYEDVFVHNKNNFKLNKTMIRDELLKIINKKKRNMSDKTYNVYKKYIKKHILNNEIIDPVIFISQTIKIVDNSIAEDKDDKIKIIDNKVELECLCDFISNIYIDIYKFLGYKNYEKNLWVLQIKRKKDK
jgi:hypothetical protein